MYTSEVKLSNGVVVTCRRIEPNLLDLFEDAHAAPEPPMREAKVIGGGTEMVPDMEDEAYLAQVAEARVRRAEDLRAMITDHVELKENPSPEVLSKMGRYGIEQTPENMLRYLMADYVSDWGKLYTEVLRLSTVTDEEVQKALDRFRDQMGGSAGADEDEHPEEPVQGGGD
jgi:hypothetical protein